MKKFIYLLFFLPGISLAQSRSNPELFAKTITAPALKKHLYILAGPEMEGRETATEGQRKAAAYIEEQFRNMGLQPAVKGGYQMYYNVYQDSLLGAALEVNGMVFTLGKDFAVLPGNSTAATMRFSEVVIVGQNAADSLKDKNLAGKLVMIMANNQSGNLIRSLSGIYSLLQSKGIAAALIVNTNAIRNSFMNRRTGQTIHAFRKAIPPQQFFITDSVARSIAPDYDTTTAAAAALQVYNADILLEVKKTTKIARSSNVIGMLPGTDLKDEYVVVSAHYDHLGKRGDSVIYYGADDDGSGTVGVLQIAEAFAKAKKAGKGPRRSMVFLANSGEEEGLWGSEYYTDHPLFPLAKTTVDLNIDMIGRTDASRKRGDSANYVYVVGDDKVSSDLHSISEAENKKYTGLELDYKYNDPKDQQRIYYRSDHYNFAKNGVPIIFYYDGMLGTDYHKPTDTPDKINYNLLAKRAQLVFYTAWNMANRNEMLKRDIPLNQ